MIDWLQPFLDNYGYWVVFFASMIEGESVILTASILASQGRLDIYKVMTICFFGTLFADQGMFLVGHKWGSKILHRYPSLGQRSARVFEFLKHHHITFILVFRFIYGIRIISPIVIGMSGIPIPRFVLLNLIAAFIWTIISCAAGYYLGELILNTLSGSNKIWVYCTIALGIICIVFLFKKVSEWLSKSMEE